MRRQDAMAVVFTTIGVYLVFSPIADGVAWLRHIAQCVFDEWPCETSDYLFATSVILARIGAGLALLFGRDRLARAFVRSQEPTASGVAAPEFYRVGFVLLGVFFVVSNLGGAFRNVLDLRSHGSVASYHLAYAGGHVLQMVLGVALVAGSKRLASHFSGGARAAA